MIEKKVQCPKCEHIWIVTGNYGEILKINCPSCKTIGKVTFEGADKIDLPTDDSNGESIVVLNELTKRYKHLLALDAVSFDIKKGEIFGYIGPNGAGKTTTIKIMVDLVKKTSGSLFIDGHPMPKGKNEAHKLIGYLPQQVAFQQWRTVNHALTSFGKLSGMNAYDIDQRTKLLLDLFGLSHVRHKKINKLSGGMIQKLGLVQALLHKPKLLILDEPLAGLDPESRYQVKNIIKDMSKQGTTVFFSSHILSDVQDIATKIGILNWGHIEAIGTLEQLKNKFIEENAIEIILSRNSGKWDIIQSIDGIRLIEQIDENKIIAHIDKRKDNDKIIHKIITELLKKDCRIRRIGPVAPNLDELYQKYLNRRFVQ